jgi:hypothetical protein
MLAAASRGNGIDQTPLSCDDPSRLKVLPEPSKKKEDKTADEDAAIWDWDAPTIGGGVHLTGLTCRVSSMNYMKMGVCDSIDWGPVTFTSASTATPFTLPLENEYVLRWRWETNGHITGKDHYWKLEAKTDQSFEIIFGYEFPRADKIESPRPLPHSLDEYFGPYHSDPGSHVSLSDPGSKQSNTFRITPLRILVVVTLICCKQRFDFDPMGALGAGRFYPMIMLVSNHELLTATGKVKIKRPAQMKMISDDPSAAMPCHSDADSSAVSMDSELMTKNLGAVLFADSNASQLIPNPVWNIIFDYYDLNPQPGSYVVTVPWTNQSTRQVPGVQVTRTSTWEEIGIPKHNPANYPWEAPKKLSDPPVWKWSHAITKMAGQGEFDNIHIAPRMIIPSEYVCATDSVKKNLSGLDSIAMAPFCIHDCMHLHVRWSASNKDIQNLGWSDELTPSSLPGAPLVPPNQKVTLNLADPVTFEYLSEAQGVKAGRWQIMMHHGASYALAIGIKANLGRWMASRSGFTLTEPPASAKDPHWMGKWASMYWNLRWVVGLDDAQYERLSWPEGGLVKLRESGSLAQPAAKAAAAAAGRE